MLPNGKIIMSQLQPHQVIVLIGMPGAGKSTIGPLLAKATLRDFIDTDLLIQAKHNRSLQDIVDKEGYQVLRELEEDVLLESHFENRVIATGGSVVYSEAGMRRLAGLGPIVHLDVSLAGLLARIKNYESRGIARKPGQSLESLFEERQALYHRYSDIRIDCNNLSPEACVDEILRSLNQ
jgi:shikimate kinase